jgi:hypothetical protein
MSPSRQIRLAQAGPRLHITSLDPGIIIPRPLVLPRLPLSLVRWCTALADLHWSQHRRCMGIFLLLDAGTSRWDTIIPRQRCRRRLAHLSLRLPPDQALTSESLLAGSVQTACVQDPVQAARLVPPFDGLHIVQCPPRTAGRLQHTYILLRSDGQVSLIHPDAVLVDDLVQTLREHARRLR